MSLLFNFLAFVPILVLLCVSLWKGVKAGVYAGLAVTTVLFFIWGAGTLTYAAALVSAFVGTINILMIIFGAVLLYHVMEQKGYISGIQASLSQVHPDRTFRFYFLAFFLTAFFESVAGFGTPGAIVPLLLIAMGYSAVTSVAVVLLIDGLFAITGAVGTPVNAGLILPLRLDPDSVKTVYRFAGLIIGLAGFVLAFFVRRMVQQENATEKQNIIWLLLLVIMAPFSLFMAYLQDLSGLLAALFLAGFSYVFLFRNKKLDLKPWLPYWLLVGLLLIPKLVAPFAGLLNYAFQAESIFGTGLGVTFQPFKSPLIPFLAAAFFALYAVNNFTLNFKPVVTKTVAVFLVLFPSMAVTQLMLHSGSQMQPSMVSTLAGSFTATGPAYVFISPFIGVLGAFISGSTTVSNIIFGPVQHNAAKSLGLNPDLIISLQLVGASLGNAVCLFNIIAAAAVAGLTDYSLILKKNLLPVTAATIACAVAAFLIMNYV